MTFTNLMKIMNAGLYDNNINFQKVNDALINFVTKADLTLPNIISIIRNVPIETSEKSYANLEEMKSQKELEQTMRLENVQVK